jgi:hypothetical protein
MQCRSHFTLHTPTSGKIHYKLKPQRSIL